MRNFFIRLYEYLWDILISKVPSHRLRYVYLRVINSSIKNSSSVLMNVRFKGIRNITFNENQVINQFVTLDGRGGLYLGKNVDIAERAVIWTMSHNPHNKKHSTVKLKTVISDHVWIGADSIILAGVSIGEGAVVGAGAVVTKDVNARDIVAGNPAKVIGKRNEKPEYELLYKPLFK